MLLEQPAELNKYDFTPPTWALRWKVFKFIFPFLFLTWAITIESALFEVWIKDDRLMAKLPWLLASVVVFFFIIPFAIELEAKLGQRRKKSLQIDEIGFKTTANNLLRFSWKRLLAWHLEPVATESGLQKLILEFSPRRKGRRDNRWSIILKQPAQTLLLKSELAQICQKGSILPRLVELPAPLPKRQLTHHTGIWPLTISCFLFLHAFFLLTPGIMLSFPKIFLSSHSDTAPKLDNLTRLIARNFSTVGNFRNFLLISGGCLLALATVFYVWANKITQANKLEQDRAAALPS